MTTIGAIGRAASGLALAGLAWLGGAAQARADGNISGRVEANDSNYYEDYYDAGQSVTISLSGDGDTDLDLYVSSPVGELVGVDQGPTDVAEVVFTAPVSGSYSIEVRNLGSVWNGFSLSMSSADPVPAGERVEAYSSNYYRYNFAPGELITVNLSGDGDTDLDVFVRSPYGELVAAGEGPQDQERMTFRSPTGGTYEIEVKNLGDVWNGFTLNVD